MICIFKSNKKFIDGRGADDKNMIIDMRKQSTSTHTQKHTHNKHTHTHTQPYSLTHTHTCNFVVGLFARAAAI